MSGAFVLALAGLGIAAISAWLEIEGKDGSGWAFVAFFLLLGSCSVA